MSIEPIKRVVKPGVGGGGEEVETHPAFGAVKISRITGNTGKMFGSHLSNHGGLIRLSIMEAERIHSLSHDRIYPANRPVAVVEMTFVQFSELITSPNMSEGVPCTLRRIGERAIPEIPDDIQTEQEKVAAGFKREATEFAGKIRGRFQAIHEILDKKSIGKADRATVREAMRMVVQDIEADMPFVLESFIESAEKTAKAAKAEVEGFLTGAIHRAGLDGLRDHLLGLGETPALRSGDDD